MIILKSGFEEYWDLSHLTLQIFDKTTLIDKTFKLFSAQIRTSANEVSTLSRDV